MIQGRFGEIVELLFEIDLIAVNSEIVSVEALLDTGFTTGWLALDLQDVEALGWTLIERRREMLTAQGETFFALYEGKVSVGEQEFVIPVHAKAGIPEILLGLQWLREQKLVVDFAINYLTLGI
jgi:predicted aspartyl protease